MSDKFYAGQVDYIPQLNALWDRATTSGFGTSTDSLSISVASKSFTTNTNLQFAVGSQLTITATSDLSKYMSGQVTAYNQATGAITVNITSVMGSGTFSDWSITLSGAAGATGADGIADNISIGTVTSGTAAASITGTSPNKFLNLTLQTGATGATGAAGAPNVLSIGTVTDGVTADATITGTSPSQVLNLVLPKGDTGATGATGAKGLNARGVWNGATAYVVDDWVTYSGSSYYRKIAGTTGTDPATDTTNWGLLASKGETGADGTAATAALDAALIADTGTTKVKGTWYNSLIALVSDLGVATVNKGTALIGHLSNLTGTVSRSLQDRLLDRVSVFDFMTDAQKADVKAGTMTLDVVSAFNAAIATGRPVYVPNGSGWIYKIGAAISIPSNSILYGNRSKIFLANGSNSHIIRIANSATNVEIRGLYLDGNKANNTGGHGIATGGTGCTDTRLYNNYIKSCEASGIACIGETVTDIEIKGNTTESCGDNGISFYGTTVCTRIDIVGNKAFSNGIAGISGDGTSSNVKMLSNSAWLNNTHGVGFLGICVDSEISNNITWDNGQGTPTADNITAYNSAINNLTVVGNISRGGLNNGIHIGGNRITVTGNVVYGATQHGIQIRAQDSGGTTVEMTDFVVSNNISNGNGLSGFWFYKTTHGTVSGNVARVNAAHGFAMDEVGYSTIAANSASSNTLVGFKNVTASLVNIYSNNIAASNGSHGFQLENTTLSNISGNNIRANGGYGFIGGGTTSANVIVGNNVRLNTAGDIDAQPSNTRIVNNDIGTARTLASAATVTLPTNGDYFYITGTTNITSITGSWIERRVTLQFDDVLTMTDGSNLNMAGNFVTTWKDTISFIFDGTNWVETSRSIN